MALSVARFLGSARVPRSGDGVFAIANFSLDPHPRRELIPRKDCFGATPKPARETRALPGCIASAMSILLIGITGDNALDIGS